MKFADKGHGRLSRQPHDLGAARVAGPVASLRLLGVPSFTVRNHRIPLPHKTYFMAAVAALSPGATTTRARLRGLLWGDSNQSGAAANLRQLLSRALKAEKECGARFLAIDGEFVKLDTASCHVDLVAWHDIGASLSTAGSMQLLDQLRSYGGDLLADFQPDEDSLDEWLSREREQLKSSLISVATTLLGRGDVSEEDQLEVAGRLLAADPTQEEGYRARIRIYGERGDIARCRSALIDCERALRAELNIVPSAETLRLANRYFESGAAAAPHVLEGLGSPVPTLRQPADVADSGRPLIAILPPVDPFDDDRLRRLAASILEDLTIGLARYRSFRVIGAHTASAIASGAALQVTGRDWCDWTIASVLAHGPEGFELKFRMADSRTQEVAWTSTIPFKGDNLPALFSALTDQAVAALANTIERRELERPVPASGRTAYHLFLEGRRYLSSSDLADLPVLRRAKRLLRESATRDPQFAGSRAALARALTMEWLICGGGKDRTMLEEAIKLAGEAISIDGRDARGFREKGYALLYLKRHDESLAMFSEAAKRNPNDADLLADYADALAHAGDPETALTVLDRAMALNPVPPGHYRWIAGSIYYQMSRYRDALAAMDSVRGDPAGARLLAAANAQVGNRAAAQSFARIVQENFPEFRCADLWSLVPDRRAEDTEHYINGLRMAGLP